MLFNSYIFIFIFLPICFVGYYVLNHYHENKKARMYLALCSLFFYGYWKLSYLYLILISILFNFAIGKLLGSKRPTYFPPKTLLVLSISTNLLALAYFKYTDFGIDNLNFILHTDIKYLNLILPLAISFFTFQQITYLIDSYKGETTHYALIDYILFVTFFPQLIAGPIVHHREMMPQFMAKINNFINLENISKGAFIFSLGLFKKVIIADTLSIWAQSGFDQAAQLQFLEAWGSSLAYTFQLYFDFSGYSDMAIGLALLFNIHLPINFFSPYKSLTIQDFWKRWHITLGNFLKHYVYIPLGGNKSQKHRTYINLLLTFFLGGLWHGAGWTFIFWGLLHGMGLVLYKIWIDFGFRLPKLIAWGITFLYIHIGWIFFRAKEWKDAIKILKGMFLSEITLPIALKKPLVLLTTIGIDFETNWAPNTSLDKYSFLLIATIMIITLLFKNSIELCKKPGLNMPTAFMASILFFISILSLTNVSEFLYFNF